MTRTPKRLQTRARSVRIVAVVVLAIACTLALVPTAVLAQTDAQTGGTVIVEEGETVSDLEAFAGSVVVEGTVTGDASAVAGSIQVAESGEIGGDFEAAGGSVVIEGTVEGNLQAATGSLEIREDATIGGDLSAGAGSIVIDGTLESNAEVGADTIRLGDDAAIAGDLRYGGDLEGNTDAVAGTITEDSSLGVTGDVVPSIEPVASWLFSAYIFAANLLLGVVLLALFPRFSAGVAARVASDPIRTGLAGLGLLIGVPIALIALAITVIGIPLSVIGSFLFALLVWVGVVYGRFAVAAWLLGLVGLENRWLALVVGLVAGALVAQIPYVGGLINFVVFLLGLGALGWGLYAHRRAARNRERDSPAGVGPSESPMD
ncbi:bactofilin family protein [Natronolimnobius baerhuensis]|uniref:Cell shape determination protein CcmA n=1 Tax=Natronolimnobius baerhuensis TaxID=253108 RepID=A0A202E6I5_9EURY|nr:polymer-forming cytoskeletal protein [Natronolimnobius baerhuensis]OVE83520.1 cell shape determination protein CcmA [Natronolimnobius baerhuensis]